MKNILYCRSSESPASRLVSRVTGADGIAREDTRIILARAECSYAQFAPLVLLLKFVVGGYKWSRGKGLPSLWVARVHVRVRVLMVLLFHRPLPLFPSSPFIVHGEGKGQIQERGEEKKRIKWMGRAPPDPPSLFIRRSGARSLWRWH